MNKAGTSARPQGEDPRLAGQLLIGLQPVAFAVAIVLSRFLSIAAPVEVLPRPLGFAVLFALACLGLAWLVTRNLSWGAILASLLVVFTLREALPTGLLAAFVVWWAAITALRRARGRPPPSARLVPAVARASAIFSLAFLAIAAASAWSASTSRPALSFPDYEANGAGGPNIYLILLDAYPRADTLRDTFGIDNSVFLGDLREMGFDVAEQARTNYNKTWLVLGSLLNGAFIDELLQTSEIPPDDPGQIRWLAPLINESAFVKLADDRGYTVRTVAPPITSAALISADDYVTNGQLTEFEANLLWSSPWSVLFREQVAPFFIADHRAGITSALEATVGMAEEPSSPQLVLAHIQSPHPPFAFDETAGALPDPVDCFPAECSLWQSTVGELSIGLNDYRKALRSHLAVLNPAVLDAVGRVVAADPEGVVIVFSDHGLRYSLEDRDEHFRSFLAVRAPGQRTLFPENASTVNIVRRLATEYWGQELEPLSYRAWWSDWAFTLVLSEVR